MGAMRGLALCQQAVHRSGTKDRGQSLPFLVVILWAAAGAALVIATIGGCAVDSALAQAGSDAVALAEAGHLRSVAGMATSNGVPIESIDRDSVIAVVVRSGSVRAGARARGLRPEWVGLDPRLQHGLARAEAILSERVSVVPGLRSGAEQQRLWTNCHQIPYPVARPGASLHEQGLAVDVVLSQAGRLAQISSRTGVCQPLPLLDPVHFSLC